MRPHSRSLFRASTTLLLGALVLVTPARASGPMDHFRAGRQAWLEKDWETAARQFSLALDDTLSASRRLDALYCRADAFVHLHDCTRAGADAAALRAFGADGLDARRRVRLEHVLADCEQRPVVVRRRILPLRLAVYGGAHQYSASSRGIRTFGAELALGSAPLGGLLRGGWIGANDYGAEAGLRLRAPASSKVRPWIEGTAGFQRLRPSRGFGLTFTISDWDIVTSTLDETTSGSTFRGTSLGLGLGIDLPVHSFFGIGLACRWRREHWTSVAAAALPGDDREIVGYFFAR